MPVLKMLDYEREVMAMVKKEEPRPGWHMDKDGKIVYGGYAAEHHGRKSVDECSMDNKLIPLAETPGVSPQSFLTQ